VRNPPIRRARDKPARAAEIQYPVSPPDIAKVRERLWNKEGGKTQGELSDPELAIIKHVVKLEIAH
jgi:hypothetical protein